MEPVADGGGEKSFSYVVRAPSGDGFDAVNVQIHTCWVFQDEEDSGRERGRPPEGALPGKQPQPSEQKPRAAAGEDVECQLRSRIRELELSERRLLGDLERLGGRVARERSAALRAQEELAARVQERERAARRLRERLRRKDELLGQQAAALERCRRTQRRQLGLARQQECVLRTQVQQLRRDVRRLCRAAGLLLAQLDSAAPAPSPGSPQTLVPVHPTETPALAAEMRALRARAEHSELEREEAARRLREQRATERQLRAQLEELRCCVFGLQLSEIGLQGRVEELAQQNRTLRQELGARAPTARRGSLPPVAEPGLDEQILVLVCGCPSAQGLDGSLHPVDLTGISEHLLAAPAPQPSVLVQTAALPPWGSAGDPAPLPPPLLLRPPREEVLAAGLPPAAEAARHPSWDCPRARSRDSPLCQESPHTSDHPLPRKAPRDPRDEGRAGKTVGREEAALGSKCWPSQESRETVTMGSGLRAPEGVQGKSEAAVSQPRPECPLPLLQGEVPVSLEGPESLGRKGGEDGGGGGLQGGLSLEEAAPLHTCTGAHRTREPRPAGRDRVARSSGWHEEPLTLGDALLWQEERPGREEEEEEEQTLSHREVWGSADRGVPQQADSEGCEGTATPAVGEPGSPLCPESAVSADQGHAWAPSRGDRFSVDIDELEQAMDECLQQLFLLRPDGGAQGRGTPPSSSGNCSVAGQGADLPLVFGNQRWEVCSAEATEPQEGGEDVQQGQAKALGPRPVPGWEEASPGPPEGPSGLGGLWPSPPWRALERLRHRLHQLLCGLERDGSQVVHGNAKLQGEQDRCHEKVRALERERAREAAEAARLARANRALLGDAARWKRELDQCLQVISELEDGNERSYSKILELEEENAKLKGSLGVMERAALENRELKALVVELGAGYKELTKELALGLERVTQALQSEHEHLRRRVCVLETDVAAQRNPDWRRLVGGGERLPGEPQMAEGRACAVDKEVQATPPSGQLMTGIHGPPEEEEADPPAGPASSDVENSRGAVGGTAGIPSCGLQGSPDAARDEVIQEETTAVCSVDPGQAPRWPSHGLQPQHSEAQASREDRRLCVRRLQHQVLTLQCQLRDQVSAGRELQLARDEAVRLQERLRSQLGELQRERREADLAVPPLKAKLASLVRKCRERNRVIAHLLRELRTRGPEDRALSQLAQSMEEDAALAEYSAAFLAPGAPETSRRLDVQSAETAAGRAQKALRNPDMDGALLGPSCSGAWPAPEAQGPAPAAPPDSPQREVSTRSGNEFPALPASEAQSRPRMEAAFGGQVPS